MTIRFELPVFYCPVPVTHSHPDNGRLEARALEWLERFGLCDDPADRRRCADAGAGDLCSRMVPRHAPTELVQIGVDAFYLLFSFDDVRTDRGPTGVDTAALVAWCQGLDYAFTVGDVPRFASDAHYLAAADISRRYRQVTTPVLWQRWLAQCRGVYWAAAWESAQRTSDTAGTFDDFLRIRSGLAATCLAIGCTEIAAKLEVPEAERYEPAVRAVVEAAELLVGLDDDLYSYPKEHAFADQTGRDFLREPAAIPLLIHERGCSVEEAVRALGDIRDQIMLRAVQLAERVQHGHYSDDTRALIDLALRAIRATLDWASQTKRYTNFGNGGHGDVELVWGGITDRPPADSGPPPYPSIAWWWSV